MVAECVLEEILEPAEVRALLDRMVKANEKKV
jgi:hypothetical protein